ncbi:hypothetical protein TNCV_1478201 [Trichonephila clavipes]|nr:hypothetical protein TNCV_1478201 [Trichonephila clavipes]
MDSYRNEMGRPPPSAKNAKTQTHTTPPIDKMTKKKICMTTPNQIPTETRRGKKITTNQAHLRREKSRERSPAHDGEKRKSPALDGESMRGEPWLERTGRER